MTDGINNMIVEFSENIMSQNSKISEAIELLNNEPLKIIFVLDKAKSLVGTVTDGDIRRGTISGLNQSDSVSQIMNRNFTYFTCPPYSLKKFESFYFFGSRAKNFCLYKIRKVNFF